MLVYRIHTKGNFKQGAFSSGAARAYCDAMEGHPRYRRDPYKHPSPVGRGERGTPLYDAFIDWKAEHMHFGCKSLNHIKMWFPAKTGRKNMAEFNAIVSVFEVDAANVLKGNKQVAFDLEKARLVKQFNIVTLEEIAA